MRASHGSPKKLKDIVGREVEISALWSILENKSVVIPSLRRMGKTCILQKMAANPKNGWKAVHYFVQGKKSPGEFIDGLYDILLQNGIVEDKFIKLKRFLGKLGNKDFGSFKAPELKRYWKELLEKMFEDIASLENNNIVFMFDEFPMMLWGFIINKDDDLVEEAKELMDIFRKIREQYEAETGIRFVFCGSIGMKIVLDTLNKKHHYIGEPINNMFKQNVLEMSPEDAYALCEHLCPDTYEIEDRKWIFDYIVSVTDRLPFFVDHVFTKLQSTRIERITKEEIDQIIDDLLNDPNNNSEFDHFVKRIKTYYSQEECEIALEILDYLCNYDHSKSEKEILNHLNSLKAYNERGVKDVLKQVFEDLYLIRAQDQNERLYRFRYELLRKWWHLNYS